MSTTQETEQETPEEMLIDLSKSERVTYQVPDGPFLEVKNLSEFGIVPGQALRRDGREFRSLWDQYPKELTEKEKKRLQLLTERIFESIVDAPKDVKKQVGDGHRGKIVLDFTGASPDAQMEAMRAMMMALAQDQSTSES